MNLNFEFKEGFTLNNNLLDGWSYLPKLSWCEDYGLITKLVEADPDSMATILYLKDNTRLIDLIDQFKKSPSLVEIILNHYRIHFGQSLFVSFVSFILNNVQVVMEEVSDIVQLQPEQAPFDLLPFRALMDEYQAIIYGRRNECRLLKPKLELVTVY